MATPTVGAWQMEALVNFLKVQFRTHCYLPTTVNISEIILALILRSSGASLREQRKKGAMDRSVG